MSNNQQVSFAEEALKREFQQEVIDRMRQYLCNHLEPERFFPFLQSKNYLDTDSCEEIKNAGTRKKRVNKMLDILKMSGSKPLVALIRAIEKSGPTQKFVAERIRDEYDKWVKRSENVTRLESVRQMQDENSPTGPYDGILDPSKPPPYTRFPLTMQDVPVPHFDLPISNPPKTSSKYCETSPQYIPSSYDQSLSPNCARSRSPGCGSYLTSYGPSYFGTNDFPPSFISTVQNGPISISDQIDAERKIPPPQSSTLDRHILHGQEKELRRYSPPPQDPSPTWPISPRTRRMPSEHGMSPNEQGDAGANEPGSSTPSSETLASENSETRARAYKFQVSCQSTSIQPSSFNYLESDPNLRPQNVNQVEELRRNGSKPNQLFNTLETIPSGEVLMKNLRSISPTRNPTEHSMISQNNDSEYEDESSLEISKDP